MGLTITLPDEVSDAIELAARRTGFSTQEVLIQALREHFAGTPKPPQQYLQLGKYSGKRLSTEADFHVAEWHGESGSNA